MSKLSNTGLWITDNDRGEINVSLHGRELRGWSYANDTERRQKMLAAREYVEGWGDGREASLKEIKYTMDARLGDCLCEMKEGYDDSVAGFNEAWDILRKAFDTAIAKATSTPTGDGSK